MAPCEASAGILTAFADSMNYHFGVLKFRGKHRAARCDDEKTRLRGR